MARAFAGPPPVSSFMIFLEILLNVARRGCLHAADQAVVECFGGIDAGIAQQVVHGDYLGHYGDVLSGVQKHSDLRQVDIKDSCGFHVDTDALHHCVLIPLLQLNDHFDALLLADSANTEDRLNVDETHPTDFHVVTLHLVTAPDENIVAALAGDYKVVGNQAMSPLDEIENALRLADAALARKEEPDAKNVGKRSVERNRRSEFHLQHRLDAAIELRRLQFGANERNSGGGGDFPEARRQALTLGDEDGGYRKGKEELENLFALGRVQGREVGDLRLAEHLKSFRGKAFDVSGQNNPGTRYLGRADGAVESRSRLDLFQLQRSAQPVEERTDGYLRVCHAASRRLKRATVISRSLPPNAPTSRSPRGPT